MAASLHVSLGEKVFECLSCGLMDDLGMTHGEYFLKRRGKRVIRPIELDDEGFSRKWSGTFIAHDGKILRDDGKGHPHIACSSCGKINVFGKLDGEEDDNGFEIVVQALGRSETDLRFLKEKERGEADQGDRDRRVVREADPPKKGVAGDLRAEGAEIEAAPGHGDREQGA